MGCEDGDTSSCVSLVLFDARKARQLLFEVLGFKVQTDPSKWNSSFVFFRRTLSAKRSFV